MSAWWCVLLWVFLVVGCSDSEIEVALSWQLPEGQTCEEAAITEVEVRIDAGQTSTQRFACMEGLSPGDVRLGPLVPGVILVRVIGYDAAGVVVASKQGRLEVRGEGPLVQEVILQ